MPAAGTTGGFFYTSLFPLSGHLTGGKNPAKPLIPAGYRLSKRNFRVASHLTDNQLNSHNPVLSNVDNMKKHGTL